MPKRKRLKTTPKTNTRSYRRKTKISLFTTLTNRKRPLIAAVLMLVAFGGAGSWMLLQAHAQSAPELIDAVEVAGQGTAASAAGAQNRQKASTPNGKTGASSKDTHSSSKKPDAAKDTKASSTKPATAPSASAPPAAPAVPPKTTPPPTAPASLPTGWHDNIITTIFWAGEAPDASNAGISNAPSAWDEHWSTNYGGYDDPTQRNGYYPAAFTPRENPFYVALPYNDLDAAGRRKANAGNCPNTSSSISWCKNAWVKITKGSKTVYAQWQDVGPLQEDDAAYVFGTARPQNTWGARAGLDVSPAVRDYLSLADVDHTGWSFVPAAAVPAGPWKNIITTNPGGW